MDERHHPRWAIEDDPTASIVELQAVEHELVQRLRARDAEDARDLVEMMLRDRIRELRRQLQQRR